MKPELISEMISSFYPEIDISRITKLSQNIYPHNVVPCDLQDYILRNRKSYDNLEKILYNSYKNSANYFKECHELNKNVTQRFYNPSGFHGYM